MPPAISPSRPRLPPRADVVDKVHGSALVSYNAGISACGKGEQWQRASALLSEMREVKLEPDVISYNAGVRACRMGEQWQLALEATLEPAVIISLPEGMLKEEAAQMAVKSAEGEDDPIWCMGKTRKRVSPIGLHVVRRRSGKKRAIALTMCDVGVQLPQPRLLSRSSGFVSNPLAL